MKSLIDLIKELEGSFDISIENMTIVKENSIKPGILLTMLEFIQERNLTYERNAGRALRKKVITINIKHYIKKKRT